MNHAVHLRFSLTHVHTKNHPFCVYEQNCWESKTRDFLGVKPAEPDPNQILQVDSTDYLLGGSLVMKNGKVDKYLFEGGYCQASSLGSSTDTFASYFYNQDHLGNIREVVDASGNILQVTNYYPFGTPYFDSSSTKNADMQPYKYNGKELDRMHGLDAYDYGARQYDPILARWDRIDPLCEKYYSVSPYAYCHNNPVKYIDPDGRDIYLSGTYDEKMYLLQQLQKLTNDRLDMNRKTGQVTIGKVGTKNLDKNGKATLTLGTKLIAGIIADDNKMTIEMGVEACENNKFRKDASNGKGTDVNVYMNSNVDPCLTENNQTHIIQREKFQPYIILGHELIHGYRSMKGIARADDEKGSYIYTNVDGETYKVSNFSKEELETTGLIPATCQFTENKLRKEHGLNKRIKY